MTHAFIPRGRIEAFRILQCSLLHPGVDDHIGARAPAGNTFPDTRLPVVRSCSTRAVQTPMHRRLGSTRSCHHSASHGLRGVVVQPNGRVWGSAISRRRDRGPAPGAHGSLHRNAVGPKAYSPTPSHAITLRTSCRCMIPPAAGIVVQSKASLASCRTRGSRTAWIESGSVNVGRSCIA